MIDCKTVLVLGAGASMPYGFPSGQGLVDLICDSIQRRGEAYKLVREALKGLLPIERTFEDPESHIINFAERLRGSDLYSIDRFLAENRTYSTVGRMFIAAVIRGCESSNSFDDDTILKRNRGGNWLRLFFNKLRDQLNRHNRRFESNQLDVVTFNYDRIFEQYLASRVPYWYDENTAKEELERIYSSINVYHVYGDVNVKRAYKSNPPEIGAPSQPPTFDEIYVLRNVFNTIHDWENGEPDEMTDDLKNARRALREADQVLFLGFGFDSLNLRVLGMDDEFLNGCAVSFGPTGKRTLAGTCFGMGWAEKMDVFRMTNRKLSPVTNEQWHDPENHLYDLDCHDFFRFAEVIR